MTDQSAMTYERNGEIVEADEDGYILDDKSWNAKLAGLIAASEDIELNEDHWAVLNFLRHFYEEYGISPAIRILTREIRKELGPEKGNSRHLYRLFPHGPVKQGSKIAGLPKPDSCI